MFTENLRSKAIFKDFTESCFTSVLCRELPSTPVSLNFSNVEKIILKLTSFSFKNTTNGGFFIHGYFTFYARSEITFQLVSSKFCSQSITNQSYVTKLQLFLIQYNSQEQFEPISCFFLLVHFEWIYRLGQLNCEFFRPRSVLTPSSL